MRVEELVSMEGKKKVGKRSDALPKNDLRITASHLPLSKKYYKKESARQQKLSVCCTTLYSLRCVCMYTFVYIYTYAPIHDHSFC